MQGHQKRQSQHEAGSRWSTNSAVSQVTSFHPRSRARKLRSSSCDSLERLPCFLLLPALAALPASVRGPVDLSHGRQFRISADCRSRRAGVQVVAMLRLQKFV